MKKTNYTWWKQYLGKALERYDTVRIDHFRGFEAYYCIPYGADTAAFSPSGAPIMAGKSIPNTCGQASQLETLTE